MQSQGFSNIHRFIVGDGDLLPIMDYDKVNVDKKYMTEWGYGREGYKHRHWNAMISHRMMIKRAKAAKWPYFLMLEDDVYITDRFKEVWGQLQPDPANYNLLYLGWWIGDENDDWNLDMEARYNNHKECHVGAPVQLGGLHAVIINESMYDTLLSLPLNNPIDSQINQLGHERLNSAIILPKIIHTHSLPSNCEGSTIQRNSL